MLASRRLFQGRACPGPGCRIGDAAARLSERILGARPLRGCQLFQLAKPASANAGDEAVRVALALPVPPGLPSTEGHKQHQRYPHEGSMRACELLQIEHQAKGGEPDPAKERQVSAVVQRRIAMWALVPECRGPPPRHLGRPKQPSRCRKAFLAVRADVFGRRPWRFCRQFGLAVRADGVCGQQWRTAAFAARLNGGHDQPPWSRRAGGTWRRRGSAGWLRYQRSARRHASRRTRQPPSPASPSEPARH